MKGSKIMKLCQGSRKLIWSVAFLILWNNVYGQNCDYNTGLITFSASGGNITDTYETTYALTDQKGQIVRLSSQTEFEILAEGFYSVYAVNYKIDERPDGLVSGDHILNVVGGCSSISAPYSFTVCEEIDNCNYCFGEDIILQSDGSNTDPGFTTEYFLTNHSGEILLIQDIPEFEELEVGSYVAFAINYDTNEGLTGFFVGSHITDIQGVCKEISEGVIIGVCQSLDPAIFFDLKGCDITRTALLQVGEVYNSYLWNTGSTSDFIVVDATTPATYRVTVTLASGCQGVVEQRITGNEVATIGDFVFEDVDGNGLQDVTDPGINGITVNLYADFNRDGRPDFAGFPSCTTVTTNNPVTGEPGYYIFHVYRSDYVVEFVAKPGFELTLSNIGNDETDSDANANGFTGTIGVFNGDVITNIDAGFIASSSVGGLVWNDADGDGVRDDEEVGYNDVIVDLFRPDGSLVATTVTLTDPVSGIPGTYCFDGLVPGNYYTGIELPDGFVLSPARATGNTSRDSDADGSNGINTTPVFSAPAGIKKTGIDFGIYPGASLCGIVWRDSLNGNAGIYDIGIDMLLPSVQVSLISLDLDQIVNVVSTDDNGAYCFEDVTLGSYSVMFFGSSLPTFVTPNVGNDELIDSDVNPTTGRTSVFFVSPGDTIRGLNAGITQPALPVELISFEGYFNPFQNINQLMWSTANEINNEYFEIQRAFGQSDTFKPIDRVDGAGNATDIRSYVFDDRDIAQNGTYYYRLKQVDFDGAFEYSPIIAILVDRDKSIELSLYPNPAHDDILISLITDVAMKGSFVLTDITGRQVLDWPERDVYKGQNQVRLSLDDIPSGPYILRLFLGSEMHNQLIQINR